MNGEDKQVLERLTGHRFEYKGRTHRFVDYMIVDGQVCIQTDTDTIQINKSNLTEEIDKMKITGSIVKPEKSASVDFRTLDTVDDILLDTIKNVRENKDYVDQAKAINSSVSNLINVQKLKVQVAAERRKLKRQDY